MGVIKISYYLSLQRFYARLFALLILCSSCHSYRSMDVIADEIKLDKKYKITTKDYQKQKAVIKEVTTSGVIAIIDEKEVEIPMVEIQEIRRKKFSYVKTLGIPVAISGFFVLALSTASGPQLGGSLQFPN